MPQKMTRKQTAVYLRELGIPIGDSTLDKLCMPSANQGPPVAAWWGRRPLYDPADALAWAEARMRPDRAYVPRASQQSRVTQQADSNREHKEDERNEAMSLIETFRMASRDGLQKQKRRGRGPWRSRN
jgi:hypothetical protein